MCGVSPSGLTLAELWWMHEAVCRNERLRLVEAATLQTRSMNEHAVELFIRYGWLGDEASNLQPPTPGEIAMLNKSYGGA